MANSRYNLLSPGSQKLVLLFGIGCFSDFETWASTEVELLSDFRRAVTIAASCTYRRLYLDMGCPWALSLLVSISVPLDWKVSLLEDLFEHVLHDSLQFTAFWARKYFRLQKTSLFATFCEGVASGATA